MVGYIQRRELRSTALRGYEHSNSVIMLRGDRTGIHRSITRLGDRLDYLACRQLRGYVVKLIQALSRNIGVTAQTCLSALRT